MIEVGQVVARAGFLVEFAAESGMVYPGENEVSVQASARISGAQRSGRYQKTVPAQVDTRCIGIKHNSP
ncbi:MAG: hypothetical protein FIA96_08590 [Betaproteobacteria bacterium]|nr:hypothetical protein [Betaproteobacteria bacterium]